MIDSRTEITVFHDDNGSFSDFTSEASDYTRDDFSIDLSATEDYLYLGMDQPFSAFYIELTSANINSNSLVAEFFDGTSWVSLSIRDESKGFTRSGFVTWDIATLENEIEPTTVNGEQLYWFRFRPSVDHSATVVRGINLVFSDDNMLEQEFAGITSPNFLFTGQTSHIKTHVSARNHIVQHLRNIGYVKYNDTTGEENLTQWDLLDIFEVRQAATFLALSKIFFNLSDGPDDNWWQKYKEYEQKFIKMFATPKFSIDTNDDGFKDDSEKLRPTSVIRWSR